MRPIFFNVLNIHWRPLAKWVKRINTNWFTSWSSIGASFQISISNLKLNLRRFFAFKNWSIPKNGSPFVVDEAKMIKRPLTTSDMSCLANNDKWWFQFFGYLLVAVIIIFQSHSLHFPRRQETTLEREGKKIILNYMIHCLFRKVD